MGRATISKGVLYAHGWASLVCGEPPPPSRDARKLVFLSGAALYPQGEPPPPPHDARKGRHYYTRFRSLSLAGHSYLDERSEVHSIPMFIL